MPISAKKAKATSRLISCQKAYAAVVKAGYSETGFVVRTTKRSLDEAQAAVDALVAGETGGKGA